MPGVPEGCPVVCCDWSEPVNGSLFGQPGLTEQQASNSKCYLAKKDSQLCYSGGFNQSCRLWQKLARSVRCVSGSLLPHCCSQLP